MGWQGAVHGNPATTPCSGKLRGMLYRAGWKFCLAGMLLAGVACTQSTPEDAVRARLGALQDAIESRDASAVQQLLAEDFIGNDGIDRTQAKAVAAASFLRHREVSLSMGPPDIEMQPPSHATVVFDAMLTGGAGGWLPERAQVYAVSTHWRESDGEWLLYHAEWTPRL